MTGADSADDSGTGREEKIRMQEKENTEVIRKNYDEAPEREWERTNQTIEFLITARMLERTIRSGEKILDIGGGPGQYSLWLAGKGCQVTLFDLSSGNIGYAQRKAEERGLPLKTICGNAMDKGLYPEEKFDHVLVMGPMYHVFQEEDRRKVIENALSVLKPGGKIYVAFINLLAGALYYLDEGPEGLAEEMKLGNEYGECLLENRSWKGAAFTDARFDALPEICYFMDSFGLRQVTMFGQEGFLASNLTKIEVLEEPHRSLWIDFAARTCERPEYLAMSSHIMYVGERKNSAGIMGAAGVDGAAAGRVSGSKIFSCKTSGFSARVHGQNGFQDFFPAAVSL